MACRQFVALAIVAVVLPTLAMATKFNVGDGEGWTMDYDYAAWAKDKVFHVGDKLVFNYPALLTHSVVEVNGTAFKDCIKPPMNKSLGTGHDVITLATPGKKWYICGVDDHCAKHGQKLVITVLESMSPAPSPIPFPPIPRTPSPSTPSPTKPSPTAPSPSAPSPSSAHGFSVSGSLLPMAAMVAVALLAV